jgi:hypothetical protein
MSQLTELVTKFTFQGSVKPLTDFTKNLGNSIKVMKKSVAGIYALGAGLAFLSIRNLQASQSLIDLSDDTGVAIDKIQELGYAASVSGSSAKALETTISGLSKKIGTAAQYGSAEFSRLGISVRDAAGQVKEADVILNEVGASFKRLNLSNSEQQSYASSLGIDPSLIHLLQKSGEEVDSLREKAKAMGVITAKQAVKITKFNDSITTLKFGLGALQNQIAIGMAPAIKGLAEEFTGFLAVNKDLIANGIQRVMGVISTLTATIKRLVVFIDDIVEATIGWKVALTLIGVGLALILSPVKIFIAAITGALLIVDDLIVAFKGGNSVIKEMVSTFLGFDITPVLKSLVVGFKSAVGLIKDIFMGLFMFIHNGLQGFITAISAVTNFLGFGGSSTIKTTGQAQAAVAPKPFVPDYRMAQSNTNSVNQTVNISVKSDDPVAAGNTIKNTLQNQLQNASSQLNKGGR